MKKTLIAIIILMFGMLTVSYAQDTPAKSDKKAETTKDKPANKKTNNGKDDGAKKRRKRSR